jgi:hypothetical protein
LVHLEKNRLDQGVNFALEGFPSCSTGTSWWGPSVKLGGLTLFPLTGTRTVAPPYLTGPEAFEAGLIRRCTAREPLVVDLSGAVCGRLVVTSDDAAAASAILQATGGG